MSREIWILSREDFPEHEFLNYSKNFSIPNERKSEKNFYNL